MSQAADELNPHTIQQDCLLDEENEAELNEEVMVGVSSLEESIENYHDEIEENQSTNEHSSDSNHHQHKHAGNRKNKPKKVFTTSQFFVNQTSANTHNNTNGGVQPPGENTNDIDEEEYFHSEEPELAYHYKGHSFVVNKTTYKPNSNNNSTTANKNKSKKQQHHHNHKQHHHNYYQRPKTKEEFVLANFHFVLRPLSQSNTNFINQQFHINEYNNGKFDADTLVDWDTIELVVQQTHEQNQECPICLDNFKAPKMTKCGHVFCYPCILRHVALGETNCRKCPLCNESVYIDALRSVRIEYKKKYKENDKMSLVLLKRDKKLIIPDLVSELNTIKEGLQSKELPTIYPVDGDYESSKFSRFNVTYDISQILEKELDDLDNSLKTAESVAESEFITLAKEQVIQRKKDWVEWIKTNLTKGKPSLPKKLQQKTETTQENSQEKKEVEDYWYYQSSDCQMIFLHPLCSKMLVHEFQDYSNFPTSLNDCPILEIETVELNEELRRRYPILKHVPCGCYISLVEIDMRNILTKETINTFIKDIKQRKYRRDEKVRMRIREEQEEKKNEERRKEEEKLARERLIQELHISNFPELITTPPPVNSDFHFPTTFKAPVPPVQQEKKPNKQKTNEWSKRKQQIDITQSVANSSTSFQLQGDWAKKTTSTPTPKVTTSSKKDDFPSLQSKPKKR